MFGLNFNVMPIMFGGRGGGYEYRGNIIYKYTYVYHIYIYDIHGLYVGCKP